MPGSRLPKLVAFDLDFTLWDLWIDTHISPPLRRKGSDLNEIVDKRGETISFYRDVPQILQRLRKEGVIIAACSRTSAPVLARQALDLLLMLPESAKGEPEKAIKFFDQMEIYPGSKLTHFKKIHEKTGIPYSEMLFFDDEQRNKEVERLGVTMHLVHRGGVTNPVFDKGLKEWRKRYPAADKNTADAEQSHSSIS